MWQVIITGDEGDEIQFEIQGIDMVPATFMLASALVESCQEIGLSKEGLNLTMCNLWDGKYTTEDKK